MSNLTAMPVAPAIMHEQAYATPVTASRNHLTRSSAGNDYSLEEPSFNRNHNSMSTLNENTATATSPTSRAAALSAKQLQNQKIGAADAERVRERRERVRAKSNRYPPIIRELLQGSAEFVGTFFFLFLAFGGVQAGYQQNNLTGNGNQIFVIALCFGFGLMVSCWFTFRISGGALNPAVVLSMVLLRLMPIRKAIIYIVFQYAGALSAAGMVSVLFPGAFAGANTRQGSVSRTQIIFIEMFLTATLCVVVLFLGCEKHSSTFQAPLVIGIVVFVAHLILVPYDGCSINPARALAGSVLTHTWTDHWIFNPVGPFLGSILASLIFAFFKRFDYEAVNPIKDIERKYNSEIDPEDNSGGAEDVNADQIRSERVDYSDMRQV